MIRIELSSDSIAWLSSASSIAVAVGSPVLALSRKLVGLGVDPATGLECYRGEMHCLTVRSIGEAATLQIGSHGSGFRRAEKGAGASPISLTAPSIIAA